MTDSPDNSKDRRAIVQLENVVRSYDMGATVVQALRGINLTIDAGEFTTIAGPSGSGKTTLLNLIGCVDVPTSGRVVVDGHDTSHLDDRQLTDLRLHTLGFIFQSFNLVGVLSAFKNVELPLRLQGLLNAAERRERVDAMLDAVGLQPHKHHRPGELSGGQRQRVAIARALITQPRIVLADEPTANLDSATGEMIVDVMHELHRRQGTTFIFSTHDPRVVERAERVIYIKDGQVDPSKG